MSTINVRKGDVSAFEAVKKALDKGDSPGHDFHGNQYSGGGGTSHSDHSRGAQEHRDRSNSSAYEQILVSQGVHPSVAAQMARRKLGPGK